MTNLSLAGISVKDFRNIQSVDFKFDRFNLVLGPNEAGKSNLRHLLRSFFCANKVSDALGVLADEDNKPWNKDVSPSAAFRFRVDDRDILIEAVPGQMKVDGVKAQKGVPLSEKMPGAEFLRSRWEDLAMVEHDGLDLDDPNSVTKEILSNTVGSLDIPRTKGVLVAEVAGGTVDALRDRKFMSTGLRDEVKDLKGQARKSWDDYKESREELERLNGAISQSEKGRKTASEQLKKKEAELKRERVILMLLERGRIAGSLNAIKEGLDKLKGMPTRDKFERIGEFEETLAQLQRLDGKLSVELTVGVSPEKAPLKIEIDGKAKVIKKAESTTASRPLEVRFPGVAKVSVSKTGAENEAKGFRSSVTEFAKALGEALGTPVKAALGDVDGALKNLRKAKAGREKVEADVENARKGLADYTDVNARLAELDSLINAAAKELGGVPEVPAGATEFACLRAVEALMTDIQALKDNLGAANTDSIEKERKAREDEVAEAERKGVHDLPRAAVAAVLASEMLEDLEKRLRKQMEEQLSRHISESFKKLTMGRYGKVNLQWDEADGALTLTVSCDNRADIPEERLSQGARAQLKFAVRMGFLELFKAASAGDAPARIPILLDDPFVDFDDDRLREGIGMLKILADDGWQIILFTCHGRTKAVFEDVAGKAGNVVRL